MRKPRSALCLLALALSAGAEERAITFQFEDESAARVAEVLTNYWGAEIRLDSEYEGRQLSLHLSGLPFQTVLKRFAERLGAVVYCPAEKETFVIPQWKRDLMVKLAKTKVRDLKWKAGDITLRGAIAYLRAVTGANIGFDPDFHRFEQRIAIEADDLTARMLLDHLCTQAGMVWRLRYGVILLGTAERLHALPAWTPWDHLALEGKRIDASFDATPLSNALAYITAAAGVAFELSPKDKERLGKFEVSLTVRDVAVSDLLALILLPRGGELFETEGRAYRIFKI